MAKVYDNPGGGLSKIAVSLTVDAGCEFGPGTLDAQGHPTDRVTGFGAGPVSCGGGSARRPTSTSSASWPTPAPGSRATSSD